MSNYILVVDDNPSDLLITSSHVEKEGFLAIKASDGFEALDKINEYEFKLFIVDLQMPNMNGIELIKRIKHIASCQKIPILITSAKKEVKDVKIAVQAGANDYLVKPIDSLIFEEKLIKATGGLTHWKDYDIINSSLNNLAYVQNPIKIVSINEVSIKAISKNLFNIGETIELLIPLIDETQIINTKVDKITPASGSYELRLSFLGASEGVRKKIRLLCRNLWQQESFKKHLE